MRRSTSFRPVSVLVQRQRRYRRVRRLRRAGLGVLGVGLLLIGWWGALHLDHRLARRAAAVPPAAVTSLPSHVVTSPHPHVTTLTLRAPVGPLQGLTAPLQTLAIHDRGLQTLPPLSATLTTLNLSDTGVTSLAGLEQLPQLTTLELSDTGRLGLPAFAGSPPLHRHSPSCGAAPCGESHAP